MRLRLPVFVLAIGIATFLLAPGVIALEKSAARSPDLDRGSAWRSGTETLDIIYYNTCTGWVWIWSGWSPQDRIGVHFDTACSDAKSSTLVLGWMFVETGSPAGYGFTGSLDVWNADQDGCPTGDPIDSMSLLPTSGWNQVDYAGAVEVPASFAWTYTTGTGPANPLAFVTDHPAAGPTGPVSCGTCFVTTRVNRSFWLGSAESPLCPGSPLNDGICDAQLIWDLRVDCMLVSVDRASWTEIKALYR